MAINQQETITRTEIPGTGRYCYESSVRGVLYKASKVLYTHVALFSVGDGEVGPLTFHKSAAAAEKTRGETGPDGPYWTKIGTAAIEDPSAASASAPDYRIVKTHIEGRRYCANVVNYARSEYKGAAAALQGKAYPVVFSARQSLGWTKAAKAECQAWIDAQGQAPRPAQAADAKTTVARTSPAIPLEGQTDDLTSRDTVLMIWPGSGDVAALRVRTDDYGCWLDTRHEGCRAWGIERQLKKPEAAKLMKQIAAEVDGAIDRRNADVDVAGLGDQEEAHMALAVLYDKRGLGKGDTLLAAWEPSLAGKDGIPFAWRLRRDAAGKHHLESTEAMPPEWKTARSITKAEATGLIGQLRAKSNSEVAIATDDNEGGTAMAKSADKTAAAASATTSASKSTRKQQGTAEMKTAAAKLDVAKLQADLIKRVKSSVRGATAKASPSGSYTTIKAANGKPIAYLNPRAKALVIHLGLTEKPEGIALTLEPWANPRPRFALQTALKAPEQVEDALKAIEAAAVVAASTTGE